MTDAFYSYDTTKRSNTHSTESREVLYPWHAWHGRPVWVHQAMVKNGVAIFHCGLEQIAGSRLLEVPRWMFDATICCGMHLAATPTISVKAMLELKRLLESATLDSHNVTIESGHRFLESAGGANAKRTANCAIAAVPTPLPKVPQWEALPYELRRRTVPLLAQLLREHCARSVNANRAGEVCDE